jgi:hypothetical protein
MSMLKKALNTKPKKVEDKHVKKLPKCTEHIIIDAIARGGFLTGSRKLGGSTESSDYDYIIDRAFMIELIDDYGTPYVKPSGKYNRKDTPSLYYEDSQGTEYSLIVCKNEKMYNAWTVATKRYLKLVNTDIEISKDVRVAIFHALVEDNLKGES